MTMKNILYITLFFCITLMSSCSDDLEKYPLTQISPEIYFKTADDFRLYVNQFYEEMGNTGSFELGIYDDDAGTDNMVNNNPNSFLNNEYTVPVNDGTWDDAYGEIRNVNQLFARSNGAEEEAQVYIGEAYFFRAFQYFRLLKRFGGVPWISEPLGISDGELYAPRLLRNQLCDSIISDLDKAISKLNSVTESDGRRVNKEITLAFKSRVCLFEGTWEKYHGKKQTPFAVEGSNGTQYLKLAVEASQAVINSGHYAIANDGSSEPYYNLFNQNDYSNNTEVLFWRQYSNATHAQNLSSWIAQGREWGITEDAIDAYLCTDGNPLSTTTVSTNDYSLVTVVENRDPRMGQTIFYPGVPTNIDDNTGAVNATYAYPDLTQVRTGYHLRKGGSVKNTYLKLNLDEVGLIYLRYAEVLLNHIEAKAELYASEEASLSQNDFDNTMNPIRDRVGLSHFNFGTPINDADDEFSGEIPWYLVEIRRERRIELMAEGFRLDDIRRWAAADKLINGRVFRGSKYQWYLDEGFYTQEDVPYFDTDGVLSPWLGSDVYNQGGYNFDVNRNYLYPIGQEQITLAKYTQNPGW